MSAGLIKALDLLGQVAGGMEIELERLRKALEEHRELTDQQHAKIELLEAEKESLRKSSEARVRENAEHREIKSAIETYASEMEPALPGVAGRLRAIING